MLRNLARSSLMPASSARACEIHLIAARTTGSGAPSAPEAPTAAHVTSPTGTLTRVRHRAVALFEPTTSSIVPTWTLGAVILVTSLVILIASLTP
jgi:hypothetical protein